jgi:NADH-quinone oxidoreductase subunit J
VTTLLAQTSGAAGVVVAEFWLFVVVGAVALGSAIAMVLQRNAVHAALLLVINFFSIAVLYAVLEAQFLAVVQLIVYAGAIMVLFLFVLMLLGVARDEPLPGGRLRGQNLAAILVGGVLFVTLATAVAGPFLGGASVCGTQAAGDGIVCRGLEAVNADGNVRAVAGPLFTRYVWPFEVTSVLLVVAAIGAIVLGRRREPPEDLVDRMPEEAEEHP